MGYHDESYGEQMEAQHGPYDHNEPPMLFPSDVDRALKRIEHALLGLGYPRHLQDIITEERFRLGLSVEVKI